MPADWPDFPSHEHIGEYFARYVDETRRAATGSASARRWWRRSAGRRAAGPCAPRTASRASSTCWWWPAGTTGSRGCPTRRTRARSTGASCTPTTTARPTSWRAGACWWWGWATRRWTSPWSPPRSRRHVPLHPPRHADRAQVRVRQARRPGHLAHDGAAALAAAPAAHPPAAAAGRRPARELRAARAVERLPARPPHDLRRRALAAHPRRDRRAAGDPVARRRRRGLHRRLARAGGRDRLVHRLPRDGARTWIPPCWARPPEELSLFKRMFHHEHDDLFFIGLVQTTGLGDPGRRAPVGAAGRPPDGALRPALARQAARGRRQAPRRRRQAIRRAQAPAPAGGVRRLHARARGGAPARAAERAA